MHRRSSWTRHGRIFIYVGILPRYWYIVADEFKSASHQFLERKQSICPSTRHRFPTLKIGILSSWMSSTKSIVWYVSPSRRANYAFLSLWLNQPNTLRKALTPFYLTDWDAVLSHEWTAPACPCREADPKHAKRDIYISPNHVAHCLESIRQSLMCSADIAPVVWHWDETLPNRHRTKGWLSVAHTCRDFDKIRDWGLEHQLTAPFDHYVKMPHQFEVPTYP